MKIVNVQGSVQTSANEYVFISYSSHDHDFVTRLRQNLQSNQITYWVDHEGIPPGASNWEIAIRNAIRGARSAIYVVSPQSFESSVVQGEIALAQMQGLTIFPVWAHGTEFLECVPLKMAHTQYIDMRGERFEEGLRRLLSALRGYNPELAYTPPRMVPLPSGTPPRNPYKGLRPFFEDDSRDFFGRDKLVQALVAIVGDKLANNQDRLVAVIGPSGSGKSSVVMAGLLPALRGGALPSSKNWIYLSPITPGGDPLENLAFALKQAAPPGYMRGVRKELDAINSSGLYTIARDLVEDAEQRVVVFIDQFEELFTLVDEESDREKFINSIVIAATMPDSPVIIVLTLRADFYGRPMNYQVLGALIGENNRSVLPLTLGELNDAITLPAQLPEVQLEFEGELVAEIAFDLLEFRDPADKTASLAGALPLLQFALSRLYEQREGRLLRLAAYRAMGGVSGAIGSHAEDQFRKLDAIQDRVLHHVFYHLVNVDEQGTPTRKRSTRIAVTRNEPTAERLVDALISNRLLVASKDEMLEVAHEALLRSWKRLADWIADNSQHIQWFQRAQTAAYEWNEQGRMDRMLWDYEELQPVYSAIDHLALEMDDIVRDFVRPQIDRLLEDFMTSPEYRQLSIVDRWGEIGKDAAPALVRALVYVKGDLVQEALDQTLWATPDATKSALIAALGEPENNLRLAVAQAIGRLGVYDAVPALLENMKDRSKHCHAEIEALIALREAASSHLEAAHILTSVMTDQQGRHLDERSGAAEALGIIGVKSDGVISALMGALKDKNWEVRRDAALALGRLRARDAMDVLVEKAGEQRGESYHVKRAAVQALGFTNANRAMTPLINAAVDPNEEIRLAAVQAFGELKADGALSMLMYRLRDDAAKVREATALALGVIGHLHAVRPLIDALNSETSVSVRVAIIKALCSYADRSDVVQPLRKALQDGTPLVRAAAAEALGTMQTHKNGNIAALLRALEDRKLDADVRVAAIRALAALRAAQASTALLNEIKTNRRWQIRFEAGLALAEIRDVTVVEELRAVLRDRDTDGAFAAALALAGFEESVEQIKKQFIIGMHDPRLEVRCIAYEALGRIKDVSSLPQLVIGLHDRNPFVRMAAARAINVMEHYEVYPEIKKLLNHPFLGVREAVKFALKK